MARCSGRGAANLTAIMTAAERSRNTAEAFNAGLALKHLLLARLYVTKFLVDSDQRSVDRVHTEFASFRRRLAGLDQNPADELRNDTLETIKVAFDDYAATFDELVTIIFERNELIHRTLDELGPEIASHVEALKLDIKSEQDAIGPQLQSRNTISVFAILGVGVIALVFGIFLAVVMTRMSAKMTFAIEAARLAAESSAQTKSDFLASMSHEIRTPMNAVIGLARLALRTDLETRQRDYLSKIHSSGQHLLGIINDILDFSRIEAGKQSVESVDFRIEDVLANMSSLVAEKAADRDLELIFEIDLHLPDSLQGDPLRIGQILINFVNNAVKFTESGEIIIRARVLGEPARPYSSVSRSPTPGSA